MYIGLFSCILVSFHICWSLFTWRLKKRHSKCNRLYFKCIYRASSSLLSCILVSFHVYWSLFINIGLFSRMLVSFHVYWSLMTCRYVSSLSNVDVPPVAFGVSFKSQSPISISLVSFQRNVVKET